jgi:hypothetical protein
MMDDDDIDLPKLIELATKRDLFTICLHEAAHAVVARKFGLMAQCEVVANPEGSLFGMKFYSGSTKVFDDATLHMSRLIGLAGTAAEFMESCGERVQLDEIAEGLYFRLQSGDFSLSDGDARMVGAFELHDVAEVISILHRSWSEILADIDELKQSIG